MEELTDMQKFKKELRELLNKYSATIAWDCSEGSDTHGIYEDWMSVVVNGQAERVTNGRYIDKHDIKIENQEDKLTSQYR